MSLFCFLMSQNRWQGLRILTWVTFSHSLPGSIKSKDHTCVWPKLLYAPRAGFEPAAKRLHLFIRYCMAWTISSPDTLLCRRCKALRKFSLPTPVKDSLWTFNQTWSESLAADCPCLRNRGSSNSPCLQYWFLNKAAILNIVQCYSRLLYRWATEEGRFWLYFGLGLDTVAPIVQKTLEYSTGGVMHRWATR